MTLGQKGNTRMTIKLKVVEYKISLIMEKKSFSIKFFSNSMPDWKKKKDPILTRIFYRPLSFVFASFCARLGISANTVSFVSTAEAILAGVFFLFNDYWCNIIGAILINVWILMDCIDGNLARAVKKQPFGEFADSSSSYVLVGIMGTCIGFAAYHQGGIFFEPGCEWLMLMGALGSNADSLMRLIYQKYKNVERKMADMGVLEVEHENRIDNAHVGSFKVRVENELGIGGFLPFASLVCAIYNALDIFVIYCFCYYGASFIVSTSILIRKAIKKSHQYEMPE